MDPLTRSGFIKELSKSHGFALAGIARAEHLPEEAVRLQSWLNSGYHGDMQYMENYFDLRTDPSKLVPGAKSVISLLYNYYTPQKQSDRSAPRISIYAYGEDYHRVIRRKLKALLKDIRTEYGNITARYFVDSGPVLERDLAKRAGLGWIGKNTLLINPKAGSYFFLAEIILDLELAPDQPMEDHCGTCTRCIDACPTEAIGKEGYIVDGSKCISYLTIELRNDIPVAFKEKMQNKVFGCDICQEVCPWNRFSTPHEEPAFYPSNELLEKTTDEWHDLTEAEFNRLFAQSAVRRTKYSGLKRNLKFLSRQSDKQ